MDQNNQIVKTGGKFTAAFTHPLFLTICILETFNVVIRTVAGLFSIIHILILIGLWIAFGNAKRDRSVLSGVKLINGSLKAHHIIMYVFFGIALGYSFIFLLIGVLFRFSPSYEDSSARAIIIGIFVFVISVTMIVMNVVFYRRACQFVKSICLVESETEKETNNAAIAKGWFLAVGIICAICMGFFMYMTCALIAKGASISDFIGFNVISAFSFIPSLFNFNSLSSPKLNSAQYMIVYSTAAAFFICVFIWIKKNADVFK